MESALYGIYALVVFVSEIERVSAANEWDFWYVNKALHVVLCLLYTASLLFQIFPES